MKEAYVKKFQFASKDANWHCRVKVVEQILFHLQNNARSYSDPKYTKRLIETLSTGHLWYSTDVDYKPSLCNFLKCLITNFIALNNPRSQDVNTIYRIVKTRSVYRTLISLTSITCDLGTHINSTWWVVYQSQYLYAIITTGFDYIGIQYHVRNGFAIFYKTYWVPEWILDVYIKSRHTQSDLRFRFSCTRYWETRQTLNFINNRDAMCICVSITHYSTWIKFERSNTCSALAVIERIYPEIVLFSPY